MLGYVPFSRKLPSQGKKTEVKCDVYICVHTCVCLKKKGACKGVQSAEIC